MTELIEFLLVFTVILLLLRKKVPMGFVMLIATILVGLFSGFSISGFFNVISKALTDKSTILLLVFLYMVSFLEKVERESGKLDRLIEALERYVPGQRLRLVVMPAFLGFLASPGGAMFSAPFVEKASEPLGLKPEEKTFINYWFRHLWEYSLPLYPATILAATLLNINIAAFIGKMYPCTIAAIAGGVIFGLIPLRINKESRIEKPAKGKLHNLFWGIFPVAALLIMIIFFKVNMALSLFIVLFFEILSARLPLKSILKFTKTSINFDIFLSVVSILIFKQALTQSTLTANLSSYLSHIGIPLHLLFFILPFFIGFLTGVTQASIAISFPLLLVMAPMPASFNLFCLAFSSSVIGILLSPTHLCLILTAKYFNVEFMKVYRYMIFPILFSLLISILLYLHN